MHLEYCFEPLDLNDLALQIEYGESHVSYIYRIDEASTAEEKNHKRTLKPSEAFTPSHSARQEHFNNCR